MTLNHFVMLRMRTPPNSLENPNKNPISYYSGFSLFLHLPVHKSLFDGSWEDVTERIAKNRFRAVK